MKIKSEKEPEESWARHKEHWESSGLSQRAYCHQSGLNYKKFNSEMLKLNGHQTKRRTKSELRFIEAKTPVVLEAVTKKDKVTLRVELPNGASIVLENASIDEWLPKMIESAGTLSC